MGESRPPVPVEAVEAREDAAMDNIRWFAETGLTDVGSVGGKGANLGELTRFGLPVPRGFVITAEAFLATIGRVPVPARAREAVHRAATPTTRSA